jgi:hypothetical protein
VKRIVLAVLLGCFLFGAILVAAAEKPIIGKWECVATTGDGSTMNLILTVDEKDGKLAGLVSMQEGDYELVDPKLEKDVFTFRVLLNAETYDVELKVSGSKLDGTWKGAGQTGELHGKKKI